VRIDQNSRCPLRAALHRLIAATLAVSLWPLVIYAMERLPGYMWGARDLIDDHDLWAEIWFFWILGVCDILFICVARYFIGKLQIKYDKLLSYIIIYCIFVAFFIFGENYLDSKSVFSALYGGLVPLSIVIIYDLIYGVSSNLLARLRCE
jgi:hypothetical protein